MFLTQRRRFIALFGMAVTSLILVIGLPLLNSMPVQALTTTTVTTSGATVSLQVYAAVSLTEVLADLENAYNNQTPAASPKINFTNSLDSSGLLLNLINQTSPVNNEAAGIPDIFISAATTQINALNTAGKLATDRGTNYWPKTLAKNNLVLIRPNTPATPAPSPAISAFNALTNNPPSRTGIRGIAIGDPSIVPAGAYARQVLTNTASNCGGGTYNTLLNSTTSNKLVFATNVRNVLSAVETKTLNGNTIDAGIVYDTDRQISSLVTSVQTALSSCLTTPIVYPLAVLQRSTKKAAANTFADFILTNSAAKGALRNRGFGLPT